MRLSRLLPKAISPRAEAIEALPLAVLEFQSPTAAIIATPMPALAGYTNYLVAALVLSMLLAAGVVDVDKLVVATGELTSQAADSSIEAFNATSIVRDIKVHAGEFVTKGEVLATLDPTYTTADLTALTQQEQGYAAEVAELTAQEDGKPYAGDPANPASVLQMQTYNQMVGQYNFTMQDYAQKISELQTQISGFNDQAAYYQQRLGLASKVLTMRQALQADQVGSQLDTLSAKDDVVNTQSELASAVSQADADERELAAQQAERDSFDQQWKAQVSTQLATALNNQSQAQQALSKAQLNNQLVELTAPQDSIVNSVASISNGSVMQPGQTLMDLTPVNAPYMVEAEINGEESGFVHPGNHVNIKFQTLPYMLNGEAKGTVVSVSPESFNPNDQQAAATDGAPLPGTPQALYYKAEISVDVLNLHNVPDGFRLAPGMPVEADLKVGKHSILDYFMQKMIPIAYESLHEP